ncbi:GTPase [Marchantia polymorpha subsp. ruderalis]|uniref:Obg family GTPase CgtA n=2 Tax=Marchantia polymorpha TaxID=3197 RepID=A0A176WCD3_MARPO|nr:hypothetical protein AXG93_1513s1020 [Marchantia polymorpha subsp. ruderalis]PTQ29674.1 hypothetical protein MARPO_0136s0003 [Marchantia polymorpha]BBN10876.1 hypothetical protein Mp_5g07180 [Marchantia polymorpha subsp. ruderalis]|eukprot:PTQ29674.1 hypothetical protein MARPO_0136s0003 [Marchantia polymorpha]
MELLCWNAPQRLGSGSVLGGQALPLTLLRRGVGSHGAPSNGRGLVLCRGIDRDRRKALRLGKTQELVRKREEALVKSRAPVAVSGGKSKKNEKNRNEEAVENLENLLLADVGGAFSVGVLQLREEEDVPVGRVRVKDLPLPSKLPRSEPRAAKSWDSVTDSNSAIPPVSAPEAESESEPESAAAAAAAESSDAVADELSAITSNGVSLDTAPETYDDDDMEWVEVPIDEFEEEEEEENVEVWEGDLPEMTLEEEEELLREAEREIAELEKAAAAGKGAAQASDTASIPFEDDLDDIDTEDSQDSELVSAEDVPLDRTEMEKKLAELKSLVQKMELQLAADDEKSDNVQTLAPEADGSVQKEVKKSKSKLSDITRTKVSTDGDWEVAYEVPGGNVAASSKKSKRTEKPQYSDWGDLDDEEEEEVKERGIPAVMRCFDRAKIYVKAGNGGNGVVAFRREKFVPFGGPSGGTGGRGGHVYIEADTSMNSLLPFRNKVHFRAGRGSHGGGKSKEGAAGLDITVKVPPGTIIKEAGPEGKFLLELTKPGQRQTLLPGGAGGRGNTAFKTGRNNAPQLAEFGEEGVEMWVELELKLVADVGIVGVPNAGKSTLLSAISAAKPEIANYPFTTLLPNLGVVALDYDAAMVVADLPGLLEGAHTGVGLGHEFLRHTERCRVLIHVVDGMSLQPDEEYEAVRLELQLFNPVLADKPHVVAYNKMDIPEAAERWEAFQAKLRSKGVEAFCMSAATREGTQEVIRAAHAFVREQQLYAEESTEEEEKAMEVAEIVRKQRSAPIEQFTIVADKHTRTWQVNGAGLERFTQMTNWEYFEAVKRFQHVLGASGVNKALRDQGVREGDTVRVGQLEFQWLDSEDLANLGEWKRGVRGSKVWPH